MATAVFGGLNLIQFLVGSYLKPRIAGNAVSLSPFLVLFAVFVMFNDFAKLSIFSKVHP